MREKRSIRRRPLGFWRGALILSAVLSLAINVATRYSTLTPRETGTTKGATSKSLDGKRQHLLNDGLHWSAPAAKFILFEPAAISVAALPAVPPATRSRSEGLLCSRPPPFC
jgi:hypothetical protein